MTSFNKGIGIANKIIGMLKEVSFGCYYFEMAVLFRQSMLINSILCNNEVLYGLTNTHIETKNLQTNISGKKCLALYFTSLKVIQFPYDS